MNYYQEQQQQSKKNITTIIFLPYEISDYGNISKT